MDLDNGEKLAQAVSLRVTLEGAFDRLERARDPLRHLH